MNNSCLCIFIYLEVNLQYKFLVVGLVVGKVNVDVIFAGYCKVLIYVIYFPIISVWECLFSHSPANRHYCQILSFCQSDVREMVSQCHFNFHLSYSEWYWISLHVFSGHVYFSFCEWCAHVFCSFQYRILSLISLKS